MKHILLVAMICVMAVGTYAQGAKVTVQGLTAKVEVQVPVDKAIKLAVNSGILARTNSSLTVINGNSKSVFQVEYTGSYKLTETKDGNLVETFESTRVSDIRAMILQWLDLE